MAAETLVREDVVEKVLFHDRVLNDPLAFQLYIFTLKQSSYNVFKRTLLTSIKTNCWNFMQ